MPDEPTLGEVLRRLDDLISKVGDLAKELKEDRASAAATFVRQDVYVAQRLADQAVVADLNGDIQAVKADRAKDSDWKRQQNLSLAVMAITVLVSIALAIANFVAR